MAIYKRNKNIKNYNNSQIKNIAGIDYTIKYDPDKYISKYNNHISFQGPNFDCMLSRFYSKGKNALPSYMNNIYDRGSINRVTEKTLKMNKFKEGKIPLATSSFIPKKSFNKIININLINSHDFKEKINDEFIKRGKEKLKTEIEKKNKEYEIEYLKDFGALSRFENFTYKTIPIEKKNYNNSFYEKSENRIRKSLKKVFSII